MGRSTYQLMFVLANIQCRQIHSSFSSPDFRLLGSDQHHQDVALVRCNVHLVSRRTQRVSSRSGWNLQTLQSEGTACPALLLSARVGPPMAGLMLALPLVMYWHYDEEPGSEQAIDHYISAVSRASSKRRYVAQSLVYHNVKYEETTEEKRMDSDERMPTSGFPA